MTAVRIPPVLRAQVGGAKSIEATGDTVGQVLDSLVGLHPSLREQLLTPEGELNRFVNLYVNGRDVRYEQGLDTPVSGSDTVVLLPAMAGG
ncbi:MAG: ubiquitin-like small modifier protein 1 [Chloroflexota bacterium]